MARVTVYSDQNRELQHPEEISSYLKPFGIWYENWDVDGRIGEDATDQEILDAYSPEIDRLKAAGGYVTADIINVRPDTPGLDDMLAKFDKEHTHDEDEVRFTVKGGGVFHIRARAEGADEDSVFAVQVGPGDLINVPRGTKHWFNLCDDRQIRCIRLFQDPGGWTPHYIEDGVHAGYQPVCWGPTYLGYAESMRDDLAKQQGKA